MNKLDGIIDQIERISAFLKENKENIDPEGWWMEFHIYSKPNTKLINNHNIPIEEQTACDDEPEEMYQFDNVDIRRDDD